MAAALSAATAAQAAIEISSGATSNMSCSDGVCTATGRDAVLNTGDLAAMLAGGDVSVLSGHKAKDIEITATLSWASAGKLTLSATRSVIFRAPIVVAGTGSGLSIVDNTALVHGDLRFFGQGRVEMWDRDDSLVINGKSYVLAKSIAQLAQILSHGPANIALVKSIDAAKTPYDDTPLPRMEGTLEGLGNTISHLSISTDSNPSVALFGELGQISPNSIIRNLGIRDANIVYTGHDADVAVLVAENAGSIVNSWVSGHVTAQGPSGRTGGLAATTAAGGTITRCHADVIVSSGSTEAGGLAGALVAPATISESYATGSVTGSGNAMAGGLVGYNFASAIFDSYASGSVSGADNSSVGGLVGYSADDPGHGLAQIVSESYSTGAVSGTGSVGGVLGQDTAQAANRNVYWDLDTSGVSDPSRGAGNIADDPGLTGLTTARLLAHLPGGFARRIWRETDGINGGYPYLRDNPPQ